MNDATTEDANTYDALVEVYDLEHAGFAADVELYLNLATVVGDPILELGCGTGRVLLPLAEAGFRVVGIDTSSVMLDRATRRIEAHGLGDHARVHLGDMRAADAAPGGPFGLVIASLNGLIHLPTQADQQRTLDAAYRALDPRGQLVLDLLNPTPDTLGELSRGIHHEGAWTHPRGGTVDKWSTRRLDASEQLLDTTLWYDHLMPDGTMRRIRATFPMRYVYFSELVLMLERAGFVEWRCYGGYELEPYDDDAERLIVTAEVTSSPFCR